MEALLILLTCANQQEADSITNRLLELRLVACVKQSNVASHFLWQGKQESAHEILLMMDTLAVHYDAIVEQVILLHSYDIPVIQAIAVSRISNMVTAWMRRELSV